MTVGVCTGMEAAADRVGSLAHARQPVSGAHRGRRVRAGVQGVGDPDAQFVGPVVDEQVRLGGRAVLVCVGQPLLDDAVGGQVDGGREGAWVAGLPLADAQPGGGQRFEKPSQAGQAGHRLGRLRLVRLVVPGLAQYVQQRAQFVQDRAAGVTDVTERHLGLIGPASQEVTCDPCLNGDQGDVVGDHVVEFPRDAQPLFGDPAAGLFFLARLRPQRSLLHRGGVVVPGAYGGPDGGEHPGPGEHGAGLRAGGRICRIGDDRVQGEGCARYGDQGGPPADRSGHGVDRDQRGDLQHP